MVAVYVFLAVFVYAAGAAFAGVTARGITISPSPTAGPGDDVQQSRFVMWFTVGSWLSITLFGGALIVVAAAQALRAAIEARASSRIGRERREGQ